MQAYKLKEQPILVRPMTRVSLLVSIRSPTLDANDFPRKALQQAKQR